MKYLSRFFFALVFLFSFSTSAWLNGQTIVEVGSSLSDTPQDEQFEFVGNTTFSGGTGFLSGLSVTGSAVGDFTFDVTIAPVNVAGTGELNFDANFISEGNSSTTNNQFNNGDVFSITVSNVVTTAPVAVGESVVFDGFTNIGTADTGTGEGIEINGVSYLRGTSTNGDNDVRFGVAFPGGIVAGPTLIVESVGTTALRGVALRFLSSVPQVLGDHQWQRLPESCAVFHRAAKFPKYGDSSEQAVDGQ